MIEDAQAVQDTRSYASYVLRTADYTKYLVEYSYSTAGVGSPFFGKDSRR